MLLKQSVEKNFFRLFPIFFVLFLDLLSFSAVIPLIPPLFLGQEGILTNISLQVRYIFLGALLASYPLAQIFSGPLLGAFSDATSRKKVLLISFLGNCLGYLFVAFGIATSSVIWLFIGNIISGLLGGNIVAINALIADLSTPYTKARYYGFLNLIFGIAFVIGPYITSYFSFNLSPYPFVICAFFAIANFWIIVFFLHEKESNPISWKREWHIKTFFLSSKKLQGILISGFLLFLGWYFFIKFFQVFLFNYFQFSGQKFSEVLSYFGFCCVLTQILFVSVLYKWMQPHKFLPFMLGILSLSLLSLLYIEDETSLWIVVTIFSIAYSFISPGFTAVISNSETPAIQGKVMGLYQSVQALAKVLAPSLAGIIMAVNSDLPLLISSICIMLSALTFFFVKKSRNVNVCS
ncbi:MAG: MFS transporter [Chlamydiae bacterium]|nr:MFS transporter [Chlamydiota bacterium]